MLPDIPGLDLNQMLFNGVEYVFSEIIGGILDFFLRLLLQAIDALYNFSPIDLNAEWWRSTYAYAFFFGMVFSFPVGAIYALKNYWHGQLKSATSALFLFAKVLFVGSLIPTIYGFGLIVSANLTEGARFGKTQEELFGSLEVFDSIGFAMSWPYATWIVILSLTMAMEVLFFQSVSYMMAIGAALFYATKGVGGFGGYLWKKTVAFALATLLAPPLMTATQTIGYMVQDQVDPDNALSMLQPDAFVLCIFLTISVWIPIKLMNTLTPQVEAWVKGGRLDSAGKTTTEVKSGRLSGVGARAAELGIEHALDIRAVRVTANDAGQSNPPKSKSVATGMAAAALAKSHPVMAAGVSGVSAAKRTANTSKQKNQPPPNKGGE